MRAAAAAASLVLAVVIVYHNALAAYFFDDDFQWLVGSWSFHPAQLVAFGSLNHFYRPVIDIYFAVMTPLLGGVTRALSRREHRAACGERARRVRAGPAPPWAG